MPVPAFLLLVLVLGCGPSSALRTQYSDLVHPAAQCREGAPPSVTPAEMHADLVVLERTIRRGYAGYRFFPDEQWEQVFDRLRGDVHETRSPTAFRDVLAEHLAFLDDNHVGFWIYEDGRRSWRGTSGHAQAYIGSTRFEMREGVAHAAGAAKLNFCRVDWANGQDLHAAQVLQPVVGATGETELRPLILSREPLRSIECELEVGGQTDTRTFELTKLDLPFTRGSAFEMLDAPFPWVRLRTLFSDRAGALDRFVESAVEVRDAPVVVLDLRRTGGGSDRYLIRWFGQLLQRDLRYWTRGRLESEVVLQGGLNFWECVRASNSTDSGGAAWIDARIERAHRELDEAMNERGLFYDLDRRSPMVFGEASTPFDGRLLVVTDRGCASACETAALLARQVPGAVIVGENTGGVMKVGEMRRYRLPNSRVSISLGHQSHEDPSGEFREAYGFLPDVWLDGTDPERDIRTLASCLGREECPLRFR